MQEAIDAIAHPGRRAMLRLVLDRELPVSEIAERSAGSAGGQPAPQGPAGRGLVGGRVDGRRHLSRVDPVGLERLRGQLDAYWGPALAALKEPGAEARLP